jgi:hypothetical protein
MVRPWLIGASKMILEQTAMALYSALFRDLPDIEGKRPTIYDVEIYSFPQSWGSSALGFSGVGGQAMTTAQTTIVSNYSEACVYFGGSFAYRKAMTQEFVKDMQNHSMAAVFQSGKYK